MRICQYRMQIERKKPQFAQFDAAGVKDVLHSPQPAGTARQNVNEEEETMLGINPEDVKMAIDLMQGHLIAIAVVLVLAIAATIAAVKIQKPLKGLVRGSAWMAFVVALVIIVDMILTGPMYGIVSMALRGGGNISEGSIQDASALCEDIADEGFVLLKNDEIGRAHV